MPSFGINLAMTNVVNILNGRVVLILDTLTAGAAYSTRLNRTLYGVSSPCMRVRENIGNTLADIPFKLYAFRAHPYWLDEDALLAHCGSNSGFVETWYDQSGNGRHVSQATTGSQPRIVNAGTIETRNSVPTVVFDGTDDHLFNTSPWLYNNGVMTACLVAAIPAPAGEVRIVAEGSSSSDQPVYAFQNGDAAPRLADMNVWARNDAGADLLSNIGTLLLAAQFDNTLRAMVWRDDGSAFDAFGNNTQGTTRSYTRSGALTMNRFCIGGILRAAFANPVQMALSEAIFFPVALSTTDRVAANTDQAGAYGITLNP